MAGQTKCDDVCRRHKQFGYSPTQHIRQYGEEFEVISEPFADEKGFVVRVRSRLKEPNAC